LVSKRYANRATVVQNLAASKVVRSNYAGDFDEPKFSTLAIGKSNPILPLSTYKARGDCFGVCV
jgi:hypothetical protein